MSHNGRAIALYTTYIFRHNTSLYYATDSLVAFCYQRCALAWQLNLTAHLRDKSGILVDGNVIFVDLS